jgi:hypothetical protein
MIGVEKSKLMIREKSKRLKKTPKSVLQSKASLTKRSNVFGWRGEIELKDSGQIK